MRRALPAAALASLCWASTAAAQGQPVPSLELRGFYPPTDPQGSFYLEPTATPGAGEWNVGAWASYAHGLVVIDDASGDEIATPLAHQLSLDYLASIGLGAGLAVGASLPTVAFQAGDDVTELLGSDQLPRTAIGDLALTAKATVLPMGEFGGFGLAALGRLTVPTGDRRSYLGDGAPTGELRLLGEANLVAVALRATAGFRGRTAERTFVDERFSHTLPWGIGFTFKPRVMGWDDEGRWLWLAEMHGAVAVTPEFASGAQSPAVGNLGARYSVGEVSAIGGVELPVGSAVGTPAVRIVLGIGWAPRFYDQDGDGIEDDLDECPEYPEDFDGFEDHDGCPDWDNDEDGVGDDEDRCPNEPEDLDGFEDEDGCPDLDNDQDGIPDAEDACPNEAGPEVSHARGCPPKDTDGDGIFDHLDKCPEQPEDFDGFEDEDGCPDLDNDRDGIPDTEDACPLVRGPRRSIARLNGCPSPDSDGDTFEDDQDQCPKEPEDFDGVDDEDGCPDDDSDRPAWQRAKPLLQIAEQGGQRFVSWRLVPKFESDAEGVRLTEASMPLARALAQQLNQHPRWIMMVGVKPSSNHAEAEQQALTEAFALVQALRLLTFRDEVSEPVGWTAVQALPKAQAAGVAVLIVERAVRRRAPPTAPKRGGRTPEKPPEKPPAQPPTKAPRLPPGATGP